MKLSKELQMWIVVAVVVVAVLYVFFAFFYLPLGKKIKLSQGELDDKVSKLNTAKETAKKYAQAKYQQDQLIISQGNLNRLLGGTVTNNYFENDLSQIMAASHITYTDYKALGQKPPLKRSAGGIDYTALYTEITLTTNYHDFCRLLSKITAMSKPISAYVIDMNYMPPPAKPEEDLKISIALLAYQLPENAQQ